MALLLSGVFWWIGVYLNVFVIGVFKKRQFKSMLRNLCDIYSVAVLFVCYFSPSCLPLHFILDMYCIIFLLFSLCFLTFCSRSKSDLIFHFTTSSRTAEQQSSTKKPVKHRRFCCSPPLNTILSNSFSWICHCGSPHLCQCFDIQQHTHEVSLVNIHLGVFCQGWC